MYFQKFESLEEFIRSCNHFYSRTRFHKPIKRTNPLQLQELCKTEIASRTAQFEELKLPEVLKWELRQESFRKHLHYKLAIEKEACNQFALGQHHHFLFKLGNNSLIHLSTSRMQ